MQFEDLVSFCILNTQLNSNFLEGEIFTMGEWPNGSLWVRKLMSYEGQNLWIPFISESHTLLAIRITASQAPLQLRVRGSLGIGPAPCASLLERSWTLLRCSQCWEPQLRDFSFSLLCSSLIPRVFMGEITDAFCFPSSRLKISWATSVLWMSIQMSSH